MDYYTAKLCELHKVYTHYIHLSTLYKLCIVIYLGGNIFLAKGKNRSLIYFNRIYGR